MSNSPVHKLGTHKRLHSLEELWLHCLTWQCKVHWNPWGPQMTPRLPVTRLLKADPSSSCTWTPVISGVHTEGAFAKALFCVGVMIGTKLRKAQLSQFAAFLTDRKVQHI